jgi:GxxExxY protein
MMLSGKVIIEVKAINGISAAHTAQILNYLQISGCRLGGTLFGDRLKSEIA